MNNSQDMANKNHLILKTTSANNSATVGNSLENKSLENTLRNRKIILSSGLKRAQEMQDAPQSNIARKQIIFAKNNNNDQPGMAISDL